jgi:hypothetical protein
MQQLWKSYPSMLVCISVRGFVTSLHRHHYVMITIACTFWFVKSQDGLQRNQYNHNPGEELARLRDFERLHGRARCAARR